MVVMQRVDEYLRYAKQFKELAEDATGAERAQYAQLAEEWDRLAKHRLEELQQAVDRIADPTPKPKKK